LAEWHRIDSLRSDRVYLLILYRFIEKHRVALDGRVQMS